MFNNKLIPLLLLSLCLAGNVSPQAILGGGSGGGSGTVTSIATTGPITGGTITSTGTIACATCVTALPFTDFQTTTGTGTSTGTAIVLYTTTAPALAAGKCYTIEFEGQNAAANGDFKIMVDSTQIAEPYNGANDISGRYVHCNNASSQAAQTTFAVPGQGFYSAGIISYNGNPNNALATLTTTQAIDWTMSHAVKLTVTAASGTYKGGYWHIYQN